MDTHSSDDAVDAFVAQLLETSFTLMTIVNSMLDSVASGRSAPDAPPVPDVLRKLLSDVLPALHETHTRAAVEQATAVLDAATEIVCSEIYIVAPERMARRPTAAKRRARRPR